MIVAERDLPVNCPKCYHPMMQGPLQPRRGSGDNRTADWYCANCRHVIWAKANQEG